MRHLVSRQGIHGKGAWKKRRKCLRIRIDLTPAMALSSCVASVGKLRETASIR